MANQDDILNTLNETLKMIYKFLFIDHPYISVSLISFIVLILLVSRFDCSPMLKLFSIIYPNRNKFKNKVVWIVGSSTNSIGAAMAEEFAKIGSKLILTATSKDTLEDVKQKCLSLNKSLKDEDILILPFNITDYNANRESLKIVLDKFNDLDVLIGNAARIGGERSTDGIEDDLAMHRKMFDINYFGNIYLAKLVTKHWIDTKSKGLKIIGATSSIAQYTNTPFFQAYIASKQSLCTFYRDLTLQHRKDGINVTIIVPGPTRTQLSNKSMNESSIAVDYDNLKQMSAKRVARLSIVALANNFNEVLITNTFWLITTYLAIYFNYEQFLIIKYLNLNKIFERMFFTQENKSNA